VAKRKLGSPASAQPPRKQVAYEVRYHIAAKKQLSDVPEPYRTQLARKIAKLKDDPRSQAAKLIGFDLYKIRQGDYRAIFVIEDDTVVVLVVKVGHRRAVYERLKDLGR
jgi:mRNA interferase RelE/StbE